MLGAFMAGCHRIRQFARENHLIDRPHAPVWLAKCYAVPATMYACQIWATKFMKQGSEFDSPLQLRICAFSKVCLVWKDPRPTGLCCESVATGRSLCSFIGSALMPSFSTLFLAGRVACSRRSCRYCSRYILLKVLDCGFHGGVCGSTCGRYVYQLH